MALTITHRNMGQQMFRANVLWLNGVSGSGNSDVFAAPEFTGHVWHVIRQASATGNVLIESSLDGTTWITLTTINVANGSAEYDIDQRSYPYLRVSYANIAVGTVKVLGAHAGGI